MTGFLDRGDGLERELRSARPRPSGELASRIEACVRAARPRLPRRSFRLAIPVALTAAMLGALASVGGVGYAASSVESAANAVAHVFSPARAHEAVAVEGLAAGGDQYRPGYGWGDPNHNHSGPPGLTRQGGALAPPLAPKIAGNTGTITTRFTVDEQAHLFISVIDRKTGKELLITQARSQLGGQKLTGKQAKTVNYLVLVPRTVTLKLAIPLNLLLPSYRYAIRIIARDPQGNRSTLLIPFHG